MPLSSKPNLRAHTPPETVRGRDVDTLDFKPTTGLRASEAMACLTVLTHPELEMIGAQALLGGGREVSYLSRLEPLFTVPPGGEHVPLSDPHLSRRPISIERVGDQLEFRAPDGGVACHIGGAPLGQSAQVPVSHLQRGVTIRLGRHVALLLHDRPALELARASDTLVGQSQTIADLRRMICKVALHPVPVLLQGESGVGKELVARALHDASPWHDGPFVAVNTGAIQQTLASSELFGHVKGAFTGAVADHDGFFWRAQGGTLFLDEIGELSQDVHALLLRVLETGEIQRVGDRKARHVQVRVIAATDRTDLEERMRVPLVQRLSGYRIQVPNLRSRFEDLGLLFYHCLRLEFARIRQHFPPTLRLRAGEPPVPPEVFERLVRHPFSGNVRELHNVARRVAIDGLDRSTSELVGSVEQSLVVPTQEMTPPKPPPTLARTHLNPADIDDATLIAALQRHDWQMAPTARYLGIARSSLYLLVDQCPRVRKVQAIAQQEIQSAINMAEGDVDRAAAILQVSPRALKIAVRRSGDVEAV